MQLSLCSTDNHGTCVPLLVHISDPYLWVNSISLGPAPSCPTQGRSLLPSVGPAPGDTSAGCRTDPTPQSQGRDRGFTLFLEWNQQFKKIGEMNFLLCILPSQSSSSGPQGWSKAKSPCASDILSKKPFTEAKHYTLRPVPRPNKGLVSLQNCCSKYPLKDTSFKRKI